MVCMIRLRIILQARKAYHSPNRNIQENKESLQQGGFTFYIETDYRYVCGQVNSMAPVPYSFIYCTAPGEDSPIKLLALGRLNYVFSRSPQDLAQ